MVVQPLCETKKYKIKKKMQQHSHNISYNPYAEMQRSSLKILQNYDIEKAVGHTERRSFQHPFCVCADEHNICAVAVNGICMGKSCSFVSGRFLLTNVDLLWANFFDFSIFNYTGVKTLFMCPLIYLVFHPPPFRIYSWLRSGGILTDCCELNSLGLKPGLARKALGYAATH